MLCFLLVAIPLTLLIPTVMAARSMRVRRAGASWWIVWWSLGLTGVGLGAYCTVGIEYMYDPTLRVTGFPMPIVMFELEQGRWVDFVNLLGPIVFAVNGLILSTVLLLPLSIVALLRFGLWPPSGWREMS
jgi:hypothetical protein